MKILGLLTLLFLAGVEAKTFNKKLFDDAVKTIKEKSYYNLTDNDIYQSALEGVLKHLEKRNRELKMKDGPVEDANVLLSPRNVKEMNKEMKGEVSGIGVVIKYDKEKGHVYPILTGIIKGGGAEGAGLKVGDQILKIDNTPINKFKSFKNIVFKIRGRSGTKVNLSILRDGEIFSKAVKRQKITWDAVHVTEKSKNHSIIKINFFNEKTVSTLKDEINAMTKRGVSSLILDLRENNGGLFEEGIKAIKLFAKKGDIVLRVKYNKGEVKKINAESDGLGKDFKVVVLISKYTKSMGEAFATFLKKLDKVTIIGEKSFGKGTIETVLNLENDHSVKFTIGRLFTFEDKTWDRKGVDPDIEVPNIEDKNKDHQLELAKLLILKK